MDRCVWGDSPRASTGGSLRKRSRPSSDSMELRDRTAMILGGSGLVGHAVARRLLAAAPRRIVLVALDRKSVVVGKEWGSRWLEDGSRRTARRRGLVDWAKSTAEEVQT